MNEILKHRLLRNIEALPEDKVYIVLDYIEFLNSKYASVVPSGSTVQSFGDLLQDKLRANNVGVGAIIGMMKVLGGLDSAVTAIRTTLVEPPKGDNSSK